MKVSQSLCVHRAGSNDRSTDKRDVVVVVRHENDDDDAERVREEVSNRREMYAQRGCASRGDTVARRRNTAEQNLTRSTQSRRRRRGRGRGRDEGSRGASKHACTQNRFGSVRGREIETKSSLAGVASSFKASGPNFEAKLLSLWLTPRSKV